MQVGLTSFDPPYLAFSNKVLTSMAKVRRPAHAKPRSRRAPDAAGGVKVRMYCQGLGDCFLLSFASAKDDGRPVYVMIDCGVIIGTEEAQARMTQVVENIAVQTGGKIDLLIV